MAKASHLWESGSKVVLVAVCFLNENNVVHEGQPRKDGDLLFGLVRVVLEEGSGVPRHDSARELLRRPRVEVSLRDNVTPIRCLLLVCGLFL